MILFFPKMPYKDPVLPFSSLPDSEIFALLKEYRLSFSPNETHKIITLLGRDPTLTEATIFSTQGSEHSSYKSSRKFLKTLPIDGPFVILGPKEDAGIVELCERNGEKYGIVYSHESHNSPSQIVPYEGAATGVGGISRDIACMGARVIGVLDALRFGDPDLLENKVIARGVVSGVAGYGNPLGVPNLGGDIFFDTEFNGSTLVNVVALGIVKEKNILHSFAPSDAAQRGYELIVVGKATDRSGFGGASFSSSVVDMSEKEKNLGAVQEPNPFLERHLFAAFADLFAELEKIPGKTKETALQEIALKDMGAGGIMCASVEIADGGGFGAEIIVDDIHTGEDNLPPHIILCSETQERFCFAVPPELTQMILSHFNEKWDLPNVSKGARASKIGKITRDAMYTARFQGEIICSAKAEDITMGLLIDRPYILPPRVRTDQKDIRDTIGNLSEFLLEFVSRPNLADRHCLSENYDQTVQGNTVLQREQSEAVVMAPLRDEGITDISFAVSVAGSPHLGRLSPYAQGAHAVMTAIFRVAAVGAFPRALTDCLNYGNPEKPEEMGEFVEGVEGVADAAKNIHLFESPDFPTPFVSGNVSLYKPCSPSAIVSALGVVKTTKAIGNVPQNGEVLFLVGKRSKALGGSEFLKAIGEKEGKVEEIPFSLKEQELFFVLEAIQKGLISSTAVIAEGGLSTAFIKMCLRGDFGFSGDFSLFSLEEIFSEEAGFLLSLSLPNREPFLVFAKEKNISVHNLGVFEKENSTISGKIFTLEKNILRENWENGLRKRVF
jgi:phosphoribosylformylglycinamidine synthase subunit PurL